MRIPGAGDGVRLNDAPRVAGLDGGLQAAQQAGARKGVTCEGTKASGQSVDQGASTGAEGAKRFDADRVEGVARSPKTAYLRTLASSARLAASPTGASGAAAAAR